MLCSSSVSTSMAANTGASGMLNSGSNGSSGGIARLSNFLKTRSAKKQSAKKYKSSGDHLSSSLNSNNNQQHGPTSTVDQMTSLSSTVNHNRCEEVENVKPVKAKLEMCFEQLINMVTKRSDDNALTPDEECVICVTRRACIRSYPCGHKVLCEKCFVKLLQINYLEGKYPVTCVFCRSPVALYRRQEESVSVVVKRCSDSPGRKALCPAAPVQSPLPISSIKRPGYL